MWFTWDLPAFLCPVSTYSLWKKIPFCSDLIAALNCLSWKTGSWTCLQLSANIFLTGRFHRSLIPKDIRAARRLGSGTNVWKCVCSWPGILCSCYIVFCVCEISPWALSRVWTIDEWFKGGLQGRVAGSLMMNAKFSFRVKLECKWDPLDTSGCGRHPHQ